MSELRFGSLRTVLRIKNGDEKPFDPANNEEVSFMDLKMGDLFILVDKPEWNRGEDGNTMNLATSDAHMPETQFGIDPVPTIQCIPIVVQKDGRLYVVAEEGKIPLWLEQFKRSLHG